MMSSNHPCSHWWQYRMASVCSSELSARTQWILGFANANTTHIRIVSAPHIRNQSSRSVSLLYVAIQHSLAVKHTGKTRDICVCPFPAISPCMVAATSSTLSCPCYSSLTYSTVLQEDMLRGAECANGLALVSVYVHFIHYVSTLSTKYCLFNINVIHKTSTMCTKS